MPMKPWIPVALLLALTAACAPKLAPVPTVVTPRFPEFVYPAPPDQTAAPDLALRQHDGWQYLQAGDVKSAERVYNDILKGHPDYFAAEAALGYVALARKDAKGSLDHFDRALGQQPQYAPALSGKGDALLALDRTDEALASLEAALAADPALPGLRSRVDVLKFRRVQEEIQEARRAAEAGRYPEARDIYTRAIAASPESALLYRELAIVEQRAGDADAALAHAQKATELDPSDARAFVVIGSVYESRQQWQQAADAYGTAVALEPGGDLEARAEAMRDRAAFATMPEEYRGIAASPTITRAQLAALLAVRLSGVFRQSGTAQAVVITDTRATWAAPYILTVTRAGVMEVYPNHTFQPGGLVRRDDLAQAVSRVLGLVAQQHPGVAKRWADAHPSFSDVPAGHLSYPAAARAVSAGVMTADGGRFDLARPVTGAEAIAAVEKLDALARSAR